jgi:hypothetical protein
MLFRRKSRTERMIGAARRLVPSRRTVAAATAGMAGGLAVVTAASSGVSALRQKLAG